MVNVDAREAVVKSQNGMALITALMLLAFLTIVGGALLTSTTIDVKIGDNYKTNTQLLFLAEAGIEAARETLRASANTLDVDLLAAAGGTANDLATSTDLTTLLATDDAPILPVAVGSRTAGDTLTDPDGRTVGTYHVFMRNDAADGATSTTDTNSIVTFVSIARIGSATKTLEVDVKKGSFPPIPSALTLNGGVGTFDATNSNIFDISGFDDAGSGNDESAIGVISSGDDTTVTSEIQGPPDRSANYTGDTGGAPDVEDISGDLNSTLSTVAGLESVADSIAAAATDSYTPGFGNTTALGSFGSSSDYHVVAVNGNATIGPGTGYGILMVRGSLTVSGNFSWYGLILLIGQGELYWNGGGNGAVEGGIFIAKTRDAQTVSEPLGPIRATRGDIIADFNGGGGNGITYDTGEISKANSSFPYSPISIREY